ncbi:MAG: hypothetical protein ACYC3I_20170 [Gemmataceae bacterium]
MKRFRLATLATLLGVLLATGCASPCGCGGGGFQRTSMFRSRKGCPCECCSSCGGGVPIVGGCGDFGDGPLLEPPGGAPLSALPPPMGMGEPGTLPPSLGAPLGTTILPSVPGRINPIPNAAPQIPAEGSSRLRSR